MSIPSSISSDSYSERERLLHQYQLGEQVAEYHAVKAVAKFPWNRITFLLFMILFLLLIGIVGSMFMAQVLALSFSLTGALYLGLTFWFFLCVLALHFYLVIVIYRYRNSYVLVGSDGLLYQKGNRQDVIYWHEIDQVWQSLFGESPLAFDRYIVQLANRKKYLFGNSIQDIRRLGRMIAHEVAHRQLPGVAERYEKGEEIAFGLFSIDQVGIRKGKERIPWQQVSEFDIKRGYVVIEKDGERRPWSFVPVSNIPNFFVFTALVHHALTNVQNEL
jgi:hypothetical protein